MRLPGIRDGEGRVLVRAIFWLLRQKGRGVPAPVRIYAYRPGILVNFLSLSRAIKRKKGSLPYRLKALAMHWTARLAECAF